MNRRSAFTLIELMIAVAIAVIILGLAVPSVAGLLAERKLKASFEAFDDFARDGQFNAISQQRSWVMIWLNGSVVLQPDQPTPEERAAGRDSATLTLPMAEGDVFTLERPAALIKDPPGEWTFWRSGVCEPVIVRFAGKHGTWTARYDALSGHGEIIEENIQ